MTPEERQFVIWLESPYCANYWVTDLNGVKTRLRPGWQTAQKECDRLKQLMSIRPY